MNKNRIKERNIQRKGRNAGYTCKAVRRASAGVLLALSLMAASLSGCGSAEEEDATRRAPIDPEKIGRSIVDQAEQGKSTHGSDEGENTGKTGNGDTSNAAADPSTPATEGDPKDGGGSGQADYTTDNVKAEDGKASKMKTIDHFQTSFSSENGLMNVEVDAPVQVPECDAFPILSVSRWAIDNDLLKKTKQALLGDTQLYDGVRLYSSFDEEVLARGETPDPASDLSGKVPYAEISKYPVDTELFSVKERAKDYADVGDYSDYYLSLIPDGEMFYGVTDGKDGSFANLAVTNSGSYGSSLKFFRSRDYNVGSGLVIPGLMIYSWPVEEGPDYVFNEEKNPTPPVGMPVKLTPVTMADGEIQWQGDGTKDPDFTGYTTRESLFETNQVSKEDALRQAEELLSAIGLSGEYAPTLVREEYFTDPEHLNDGKDADGKYGYTFTLGKAWHIVFQRSVNGNVLEDYGEKVSYHGGKHVWFGEGVVVYVNDNGIIGLSVNDPLKVEREIVENGTLMDFSGIREIYRNSQLDSLNTSTSFDSILQMTKEEAEEVDQSAYHFQINEVTLRYARITENNDFREAILVPVWSFCGTCLDDKGNVHAEGSFLEINAVDGSVYNAWIGN